MPQPIDWEPIKAQMKDLGTDILIAHLIMKTNRMLAMMGDPSGMDQTRAAIRQIATQQTVPGIDPAIADALTQLLAERLDDVLSLAERSQAQESRGARR